MNTVQPWASSRSQPTGWWTPSRWVDGWVVAQHLSLSGGTHLRAASCPASMRRWAGGRERRTTCPRSQQASRRCRLECASTHTPLPASTHTAAALQRHPARSPPLSWGAWPRRQPSRGSNARHWCCLRRRRRQEGQACGDRPCGSGSAPLKPYALRRPRSGQERQRGHWQQAAGLVHRRRSQRRRPATRTRAATASPTPTCCSWGASRR